MIKLLSALGGLAVVVMILYGTWPVLIGKPPTKPLVKPEKLEQLKNDVADGIKDVKLD